MHHESVQMRSVEHKLPSIPGFLTEYIGLLETYQEMRYPNVTLFIYDMYTHYKIQKKEKKTNS